MSFMVKGDFGGLKGQCISTRVALSLRILWG